MKHVLIESYKSVKKRHGIDPSKPGAIRQVVVNDSAWNTYVETLAESISSPVDKANFKVLAENTRIALAENSFQQINPYEAFSLPILRVFYPKLVAKEAVTLSPMDKPETVKAFFRAFFSPSNSIAKYTAPVINQDVSGGPQVGTPIAALMPVPVSSYDVLATVGTGVNSATAHLERDFRVLTVSDGTNWVDVDIVPAVEGHFSSTVSTPLGDDVISGYVDYLNGTVSVSSTTGIVQTMRYHVTLSLEENRINPRVSIEVDKIRLYAKDRVISANYSIHMEQDMRALFDVSIQAELVNMLGQQIALDIDREIISNLIFANQRLNSAAHTSEFTRTPPTEYTWGPKYWHENVLVPLNELSSVVYNDTHMDAANTILTNPLDTAILEDINTFNYVGTSSLDGDLGYRTATVAGGKWKILTSAVVPQGSMVVIYKPVDELKSVFFYSPYVPAVISPYPLGATPSLTILSRYATALVRPAGIAVLNIV